VLNRELGADFDLNAFEHVAQYDEVEARMDIRLRSLEAQTVRLDDIDLSIEFAAGEEMRTEISTKFTYEKLASVYTEAGLTIDGWFTDADCDYALSLARPA
jgi:L-histidine N-alpha-methyltransferase